ncbi:MAG: APC family permease, partial [archaeon]
GISLIEILGLVVVIVIGIPTLSKGFIIPEITQLPTVLYGTAIVFFAFLGFEELVRMSEETKDAKRKMPIALLAAIAFASVLYVLVSASAIGLVGAEELGKSSSPLATVVKPSFGETGFVLMSLVGLFSTFNTVLLIILAGSRLLYGMGKAKTVPSFFGETRNSQPMYALLATVLFSCSLLMIPDITILAQMTDALLFSVFAVMNLVVLKLHWKKSPSTGFRVPLDVGIVSLPALLGLVSSLGMLFFIHEEVLLYSAAFFTIIAVVLHWFRGKKSKKGK